MTLSAAASAKAAQLDLAALRRRHVTAPTDPGLLAKPCPVCKDRFKAEWSEEDEEWVFWNAVELEDGSVSFLGLGELGFAILESWGIHEP